jgi:hypothetical protein
MNNKHKRPEPTSREINDSRLITDKIIAEVTASVNLNKPPMTMETQVIEKANNLVKEVFHVFKAMHNLQVVPMKKEDAVDHIYKIYRDRFSTWSKEELLVFASYQQAVMGA